MTDIDKCSINPYDDDVLISCLAADKLQDH